MRDAVLLGVLSTAFATLWTVHLAISVRLLGHAPRWRGLAALAVPPLAPWWAHAEGWRKSRTVWLAAAGLYALALVFARR